MKPHAWIGLCPPCPTWPSALEGRLLAGILCRNKLDSSPLHHMEAPLSQIALLHAHICSSVDCLIGRSEVVLGLLIEGVIPAAGLCFLVSGCDVYCPFPCNRRVASAVLYLCAAKLLDGRGELIHHVPSSGDVRSKEKLPIFHQLCGYQTVV